MKTLMKHALSATLITGVLLMSACAGEEPADTEAEEIEDTAAMDEAPVIATATLAPTEGSNVEGTVTFTEVEEGVLVQATVSGLEEGLHGFHVHETGDCSAPDASSAGGHFAPQGSPHGAPDAPAEQRHVGDLGNLEANAEGIADYSRMDSVIALSGPNSIVGKAVIVHADEDDLTTQPTGNAGARLACGVIELQGGAREPDVIMEPDTAASEAME